MSSEVMDVAPRVEAVHDRVAVRDPVVDVARGLAIVFVVVGHNAAIARSSPQLVHALFLFHVPLFFLLSGYVFRREYVTTVLNKLVRRLLVPCFVAAVAVGMIKSFTRDESLLQTLVGIAWATGQTLPWSHLWFLPSLFLSLSVTQVLGYLFGEHATGWAIGVLMAVALTAVIPQPVVTIADYSFVEPVGMPWSLDLLAPCLIFVLAGQLLQIAPALWHGLRHPAVTSLAALAFVWTMSIATIDLNLRLFTPLLPALLAALSGCILALNMASWISLLPAPRRICAFVGRHTLPIFLLHVSIQKALLRLDGMQQLFPDQPWIAGLIAAALAVGVSVMVERFLIARVSWLRFVFLPGRTA